MAKAATDRSSNYFRQLRGSFVFKAFALLATFLAMPVMIRYLGNELFGIWATMLTLVSWVMLFDFGIGNGLKNKITESIAQGKSARGYISSAYFVIGIIAVVILLVLYLAGSAIRWQSVFNTSVTSESELREAVFWLAFFVILNFWMGLVANIYHGIQKTSLVIFGQFLSNTFALLFVYFSYLYLSPSILIMVVCYGVAVTVSNVVLTGLLYFKHQQLFPSFISPEIKNSKELIGKGGQFFIIQIAVLVIFMTDKIVITQTLGPESVTPYEVVFKLFSVFTVLHAIILTPLWPAYADAYYRGEYNWMKRVIVKQLQVFIMLSVLVVVLASVGSEIISIWIGNSVNPSQSLLLLMSAYIIVTLWNNVFAYFVNAIGALRIQLLTAIVAAIMNIPLSVYLAKNMGLGVDGVVLGTITSLSLFSIFGSIQVWIIVKNHRESTSEESISSNSGLQ